MKGIDKLHYIDSAGLGIYGDSRDAGAEGDRANYLRLSGGRGRVASEQGSSDPGRQKNRRSRGFLTPLLSEAQHPLAIVLGAEV